MRSLITTAVIVAITSTAPQAQSKQTSAQQAKEHAAQSSAEQVVSCVYASADTLAGGTALAADIAEAALGECGREERAYRVAVADYFVSLVSRSGERRARARAESHVDDFLDTARRMVISRVIRARDDAATRAKSQP